MAIHILDAATVGKISAGEVVERPASAAKEMIENALDAGASAVTVEVKDGGNSYLRITDNGCGIPANEVRIAFENHATSKLTGESDLADIRTLGFRGEALPSIAAVSKVEMTTRRRGCDTGMKILVEGGSIKSVQPAGCPEGTTVIMRDIFFNTPVRRAFLKRPNYEFSVISELVAKMILGNPSVAIRLINGTKTVYHSYGDGQLRHAMLAVYGREVAEKMTEIDESEGGMRIYGMIGVGELARSNRSHQAFFINGRLVRCQALTQVLESTLKTRVTIGMYPMCALNLVLPATAVDVNVHPNKMEVRFRDEDAMRMSAEALLKRVFDGEKMLDFKRDSGDALQVQQEKTVEKRVESADNAEQTGMFEKMMPVQKPERASLTLNESMPAIGLDPASVRPIEFPAPEPSAPPQPVLPVRRESAPVIPEKMPPEKKMPVVHPVAPVRMPEKGFPREMPSVPVPVPVEAPVNRAAADGLIFKPLQPVEAPSGAVSYRIIGVVFQTYILIEVENALLLIDQHAAHERLLYEKYRKMLDEGRASQQLLVPQVMPVSAREQAILTENEALIREAGYEIEPFGDRDIRVTAVPHILGKADMRMLFGDMIDALSQLKSATEEMRLDEIIQMSCKKAIKGGDRISDREVRALIEQMLETGAPPTCPHGRPVVKKITRREMETMFKRIQ